MLSQNLESKKVGQSCGSFKLVGGQVQQKSGHKATTLSFVFGGSIAYLVQHQSMLVIQAKYDKLCSV